MGGAVSSGRDNNELIDNLMDGNYIRSPTVERVFRALDRADYMTPDTRDQAYKDLAWRNGPLHMSSPCIYSEVMEGLELRPGLSFLNIGSGTGYLSTMVGLILGSGGISHGVEIHPCVVEYATKKISQFIENSPVLDDFDFCLPTYYCGNGLCLAPLQAPYDRVYCGAGCPEEYENYFKQLIRVGGILVMPLNETLLQIKRVSDTEWVSRSLLNVSFMTLQLPNPDRRPELIKLDEQTPPRLQLLSRGVVRAAMRRDVIRRHSELREMPRPPRPPRNTRISLSRHCPRRICIPIEEGAGSFEMLHDLDRETGANEMNALLSLVLSMGENRVAGALRLDSPYESSAEETVHEDYEERVDVPAMREEIDRVVQRVLENEANRNNGNNPDNGPFPRVLTFEFRDAQRPSTSSQDPDQDDPLLDPKQSTSTNAEVPADVQVFLEREEEEPETSKTEMEWEDSKTEDKREQTSDEDTETTSKGNDENKQKLDSGIGEENSPSNSSPDKTTPEKSEESEVTDSHPSDCHTDDTEDQKVVGRSRQQKRSRCNHDAVSSSDEDCSDDEAAYHRRRNKRRAREGGDARRVRLSTFMKRAVKELPLPHALKKYVNFGRCFQF